MNQAKYRILILDDDFALGEMLKEYLQNTGQCSVTCVSSEPEFWNSLAREPFDILFLDYKLPNTTGLEILARMGQAGINIPTVMMTGEGNENIAARAIQSGALDYLVKGAYSFDVLPPLIQKAVRLREIQRAMQQSLEQIRYQAMLLDNIRDAVVVWGLDGSITYWNVAAEQLYGATAGERLGKSVHDVYFPAFDPRITAPEVDSSGSVRIEHQYLTAAGKKIWISAHIIKLFNEEDPDTPTGFMNVARDITQLKAAQTHLAQAARLSSIGQLASGVAHQISNPLTTIIAEAQMIMHELEPGHPARESIDAIIQAGWRAQGVINELMKFSQPGQANRAPVSINETIQNALLLASAPIEAAGVRVQVELQPDLPTVIGNERQLTDLWVNLCLIARAAFQGDHAGWISIKTSQKDASEVLVEITDNGLPIPEEQYDTIFEPQLIPTGAGRGTGMELSLCREIVRQNNGVIAISGNKEETMFTVQFPVMRNG